MISNKFQSLLFLLITILIAISIGGFLFSEFKEFEKEISFSQISTPYLEERDNLISLILVGDIMLDRGVEYMIEKQGSGDYNAEGGISGKTSYKFPFSKINDYLKRADVLFGNLEGPISDKGVKVGSIYSFRNNPKAIEGLVFSGFDILSVANNHIFDYGRKAMEDTFLRLKEAKIDYVGAGFNEKEAHSSLIKEIKGIKIAFLGYTNLGSEYWSAKGEKSGIAWLNEDNLKKDINSAKNQADLVVVSMHFGDEYMDLPNSEQKFFAHLAVDSGADLVLGHHPHVIQPIEQYKTGFIAYSLGNFIFDQGFSEKTMKGLILKVLIEDDKIKELIPLEIKINQYFQPEISNQ